MVSCKAVANVTHSKYGTWARAIQGTSGYVTTIAQTMVTQMTKISMLASKLFRRPNCNGVNAKFAAKFNAKGMSAIRGSTPSATKPNAAVNETKMMRYSTVHTGPKTPGGGAQEGLRNCEYHE